MNFFRTFLYPFALLYGLVIWLRNKLFDAGILRQVSFDIPVICVGNIAAGGTGKTPHIEYLIRLLRPLKAHLSTLSRGYGRKTCGFILAEGAGDAAVIGDEPCQFVRNHPGLRVAVDERRVRGIRELLSLTPPSDCILLDDAYQHRYVKPGLNIMLTDYFHPYYEDHLLPVGMLREFRKGMKRADIIVVTKCPAILSPITRNSIIHKIRPDAHQHIYFSFIRYGALTPLNPDLHPEPESDRKFYAIMLIAGIANTYPLEEHLKRNCVDLEVCKFPDHHNYTREDLLKIREKFCNIVGKNKVIVTTEKDRMKLSSPELLEILKDLPVFYQPIEVDFYKEDKAWFDKQILEYVGKN